MAYWNDETETKLRELHDKGCYSASEITELMPKTQSGAKPTRNMILAKIWRLGLRDKGPTVKARDTMFGAPVRMPRPKKKKSAAGRPAIKLPPRQTWPDLTPVETVFAGQALDAAVPVSARKPMDKLEPQDCRWPLGDPLQPGFGFCGHARLAGLPYCESHMRRAYTPPQPRRTPHAASSGRQTEPAEKGDSQPVQNPAKSDLEGVS